jgi:hypothetical protein
LSLSGEEETVLLNDPGKFPPQINDIPKHDCFRGSRTRKRFIFRMGEDHRDFLIQMTLMVVDCPLPGAAEARLPVDFPGGFGRGSQDLPM